jgi:hypothetical protein
VSNPQRNEIIELYRASGGDISKVAKELGVRPSDIRREITPAAPVATDLIEDHHPQPARDNNGFYALGRVNLRKYIVSKRHALGLWPEADRKTLAQARQDYDAGTHVMVQGRDGSWIIQYVWKRSKPVPPINWFYGAYA